MTRSGLSGGGLFRRPSRRLRANPSAIPPAAVEPDLAWVRAVVFDMDGLLLDTETLARKALRASAESLGFDLSEAFCALMIGAPADTCRHLLVERYGDALPADTLLAAASDHLARAIDAGELRVKPGVPELLDWLDRAGLPYAVATSSKRSKASHHLQHAGILERFDVVVTRDDVARGKPHPDLFLAAAQALRVDAQGCLALEDSYNGVRAAAAAGMRVIMVPDLLVPTDEMHTLCLAISTDLHAVTRALAAARLA